MAEEEEVKKNENPPPEGREGKLNAKFQSSLGRWDLEVEEADMVLGNFPSIKDCENIRDNIYHVMNELKDNATTDACRIVIRQCRVDYEKIRRSVNKIIDAALPKPVTEPVKQVYERSSCELKKIPVPKFNGSIRGYSSFKYEFRELVESQCSPKMAMIRLKTEAMNEGTVEYSIVRSKTSIDEAWLALDRMYGRSLAVKDAVLRDIRDIHPVTQLDDTEGLRAMITAIVSGQADLKVHNLESTLSDNCLSMLLTKLPYQIRSEIDGKIYDDNLDNDGALKLLIEKCERYAIISEMHNLRTEAHAAPVLSHVLTSDGKCHLAQGQLGQEKSYSCPKAENQKSRNNGYNFQERSSPRQPQKTTEVEKEDIKPPQSKFCLIHKDSLNHTTAECKLFTLSKTPDEQVEILTRENACKMCFLTNHKTEKCRSRRRCAIKDCKKSNTHATILHSACLSQSTVMTSEQVQNVTHPPTTDEDKHDLNHHLGLNTVRPSHHVFIKMKTGMMKANLLYDNGATLSQVRGQLAESSTTKPVNKLSKLMMCTAGNPDSVDWGQSELYKLPLYNHDEKLVTILKCVTVPYIGKMDNGTYDHVVTDFTADGLDISQLLPSVTGDIDILVGNNHASLFPQTVNTRGEVVWAETKFGPIIHGSHHSFPVINIPETDLVQAVLEATGHCLAVSSIPYGYYHVAKVFMEIPPSPEKTHTGEKPQKREPPSVDNPSQTTTTTLLCSSCSCLIAKSSKSPEETAFDRLTAIENQVKCYRCDKCLPGRHCLPRDIDSQSRWQNGENFMEDDPSKWPIVPASEIQMKPSEDMELRIKDPRMIDLPSARKVPPEITSLEENRCDSSTLSTTMLQLKIDSTMIQTTQNLDLLTLKILNSLNMKPLDPKASLIRLQRRISRMIRFIETTPALFSAARSTSGELVKLPDNFKSLRPKEKKKWINSNDRFSPTKREMNISMTFLLLQAQKLFDNKVQRHHAMLNPQRDKDGVWRAVGRTSQVVQPPILVPERSPLAIVLIRHYHAIHHAGADTTLALVREKFWIINGRRLVNRYVHHCAFCHWMKKQIAAVEMGPLKDDQCLQYPVFSHIAVDLAGPYTCKADRRPTRSYNPPTGKVWVLVIVCKSSRACHLELAEGYDTSNFLLAFDAFTQIRGKPTHVLADMGTQIVGAAGVLERLWTHADPAKIRSHSSGEIQWDFIPSGAHHFLGSAERMVQCFKKTMEAVTHSKSPQYAKLDFQRLLYAISNIINDRPLSVGSTNVAKFEADRLIRPNDLLIGRSNSDITPLVDFENISKLSAEQKQYVQLLSIKDRFINAFWSKWYEQVFSTLLPRSKWHQTGRQICLKDIVIIRDTSPVRGKWSWGEVSEVHPSVDGVIRKATIRYKTLVEQPDRKSVVYSPSPSKFVLKSTRDLVVILPVEDRD